MQLPGNIPDLMQNHKFQDVYERVSSDPTLSKLRRGEYGETLLHLCAHYDSKEVLPLMKLLIDSGADVNAVDFPYGNTPLHKACDCPPRTNTAAAEILIAAGADVNAQNSGSEDINRYKNRECHALLRRGITPLHYAIYNDQAEHIPLLLSHGASPFIEAKDPNYGSALDMAREKNKGKYLPEFFKRKIDFRRAVSLRVMAEAQPNPPVLQFEYCFLDPLTTPASESDADRRKRIPYYRLNNANLSHSNEEIPLTPNIEVPLATDGLPCKISLEIGSLDNSVSGMLVFSVVNGTKGSTTKFRQRLYNDKARGPFCFTILANFE